MTSYDEGDETQDCAPEGCSPDMIRQASASFDLREALDNSWHVDPLPTDTPDAARKVVRAEAVIARGVKRLGFNAATINSAEQLAAIGMVQCLTEMSHGDAHQHIGSISDAATRMWSAIQSARVSDASLEAWRAAA